ncbi:MAG: sigma-70 family RNA polymerase sigma factor [Gracilibacteraceae bacterium]|jgi:RNA polymerase sigma-70 factor (ECF subfamily)|nr:sigma-70 family RNA polymerase sigma factor [Gracilibacteraceae bacterium]
MDSDLFSRVYDSLFPAVYRYVCLRIPAAETEDVTAEIMARIWKASGGFAGKSSLKTWALKIAARRVAEYYRRRKQTAIAPLGERPILPPGGLNPAETVPESLAIRNVFTQLPENQVAVIELRLIEGLSARETAEVMAVTPQAVDSLLYRAKQSFRRAWEQETASVL